MPLTLDFKETIRARAARDSKFRKELLREGVECMLSGDTATAKTILRDYINATVGFAEVAEATHIPWKVSCECWDQPATRARTISSKLLVSCRIARAFASTSRLNSHN
jgi:hypothetical protein